MPIDVLYEGVVLTRGAKMMSTSAGTFVEMEAPMPVGSRLVLEEHGAAIAVRVERVHEGGGAGVYVVPEPGSVGAGDFEAEAAPPAAAGGVVEAEMPPADTEPLPTTAVPAAATPGDAVPQAAGGDGESARHDATPTAVPTEESRPVEGSNGGKRRGKRRR